MKSQQRIIFYYTETYLPFIYKTIASYNLFDRFWISCEITDTKRKKKMGRRECWKTDPNIWYFVFFQCPSHMLLSSPFQIDSIPFICWSSPPSSPRLLLRCWKSPFLALGNLPFFLLFLCGTFKVGEEHLPVSRRLLLPWWAAGTALDDQESASQRGRGWR